jgi:hypothetical protein
MGFKSILKTTLKIAANQAVPMAEAFGVPGASTVREAVDLIHGNEGVNNDEAVKMLAATVDALDRRLQLAEKEIKALKNDQ